MKYSIITYGCQMNEHDSEQIAYLLSEMGYETTDVKEDADLILYNTCLVRENAEMKVYGQLGSLKHWKEDNPDRILAVSGCMMQTGPARDVITSKYKHVDLIFGTGNIPMLPELIARHRETGETIVDVSTYDDVVPQGYRHADARTAYVNIMTGCNNFCTYCIVPYARGREKSRDVADILEEVRQLAKEGYLEVTLLGQNVNSYKGLDENGEITTFPNLLRRVDTVEGIERIRFMTPHPKDLSDDLLDAMAESKHVANQIHLPLQSGSTKVLREMNRRYTKEDYLTIVEKIRQKLPDVAISTDIIVGFPGETDADHEETLDVCRKTRYDMAFTFLYSKRPGTPAAKREDQVDEADKSRRFQSLIDTLYPIFYEQNEKMVGKVVRVLVEGPSKTNPEVYSGRSSENKIVLFPANGVKIGTMVDVLIQSHNSFSLEGVIQEGVHRGTNR